MFKTLSRFTSSFAALLSEPPIEIDVVGRLEHIRIAMLYQLAMMDDSAHCSYVWLCVVRAREIQALWFLRSDLVSALANSVGEQAAREKVDPITEMFRGLIPKQYLDGPGPNPRNRAR